MVSEDVRDSAAKLTLERGHEDVRDSAAKLTLEGATTLAVDWSVMI